MHLRPTDKAVGRSDDKKDGVGQTGAPVDVRIADSDVGCSGDHPLGQRRPTDGADVAGIEGREPSPSRRIAVVDRLRAFLLYTMRREPEREAPQRWEVGAAQREGIGWAAVGDAG